jgi:hypothetical protein
MNDKNKNGVQSIKIINKNTVVEFSLTPRKMYYDDDDSIFDNEWTEIKSSKRTKRINSMI